MSLYVKLNKFMGDRKKKITINTNEATTVYYHT